MFFVFAEQKRKKSRRSRRVRPLFVRVSKKAKRNNAECSV